jgi:ribosomal protein L11 methyltransferase
MKNEPTPVPPPFEKGGGQRGEFLTMHYLELNFSPILSEDDRSILIAELMEVGFDSFTEEENALLAYISPELYHPDILKDIDFLKNNPEINYSSKPLEDINWNKEWESNYEPVTIAGKCHVRAPHHQPAQGIEIEIVIEPDMAFGTAHHQTTQLMAEWLMELDVKGKSVLDMGCGTGVLAILANKLGAEDVTGIDIDEWAWRNAATNFSINGLDAENAFLGDASLIRENSYDLILANINRNILLKDLQVYCKGLKNNGLLLMSGFYVADIDIIRKTAENLFMEFKGKRDKDDWAIVFLQKLNG